MIIQPEDSLSKSIEISDLFNKITDYDYINDKVVIIDESGIRVFSIVEEEIELKWTKIYEIQHNMDGIRFARFINKNQIIMMLNDFSFHILELPDVEIVEVFDEE